MMNTKQLYEAIKKSAEEINEVSPEYGFFALRKVQYLSENSPIEKLIKYGEDIEKIAEMVMKSI